MTTLITNISCSSYNVVETLSTLRFGNRAKSIQNRVTKNEERSAEEIKMLWKRAEKELQAQKQLVKKLLAAQDGKKELQKAAKPFQGSNREQDPAQKNIDAMEAIQELKKEIEEKGI